jgi:SAM-dependent methyltransferase
MRSSTSLAECPSILVMRCRVLRGGTHRAQVAAIRRPAGRRREVPLQGTALPRGMAAMRSAGFDAMEDATYAVEAAIEQHHWWFLERRRLFAREIGRFGLRQTAPILEVGASTGTNLRLLRELGFRNVTGLDLSEEAIRHSEAKGLGPVHRGDICDLPFPERSFELVLATDVIEHVADDDLALREVARVLTPGGRLLLTVPAFPSIWGLQDEVGKHFRRYRMRPLLRKVAAAGLQPDRRYHFNYLLFAPIWIARRVIDTLEIKLASENEVNSPLLNHVLSVIFRLDALTAPILRPPFGVSIFILARTKDTTCGDAVAPL